jgi:ribosomal-protein-alanine N-acetyltransferase
LPDYSDDLRIRLFKPSDIEAIMEIEEHSFKADAFSRGTFLNLYSKFPDLFIVAEKNKHIRGYMITGYFNHGAHIISIAVESSYRQKGIGKALVHFTFEELKSREVKAIDLDVRVTNENGLMFWKLLGFLPLRVIHGFYEDGEDALRMRKQLPEDD